MIKNLTISNYLIADEAKKRGIKVSQISPGRFLILNYKGHEEIFQTQFLSKTSVSAKKICLDKDLTKITLKKIGISTLEGKCYLRGSYKFALDYANKIGWPVVIKPRQAIGGSHVYVNVENESEFKSAWDEIIKKFPFIIIEKMFAGDEYRILATKDRILGVTNRVPANVIGDGSKTILELIKMKNSIPKRSSNYITRHNLPKVEIVIDDVLVQYLKKHNLTLDYIPQKNEKVFLRQNSNITTGGDSIECTDIIDPSVEQIALKIIQSIPGIFYAGIDLLTKDITKKQSSDKYAILEVNWNPGLALHQFPHFGKPRNVAKEIIDIAFPETIGIK